MTNEEAMAWVIRTRDPAFTDWDGFTAWLERDPANAQAYDVLMAADADLDAIIPPEPVAMPVPANDVGVPQRRPLRWIGGGAIAAALVAAVSVGMMNRADIYTVTTRPAKRAASRWTTARASKSMAAPACASTATTPASPRSTVAKPPSPCAMMHPIHSA